MSVSLPLGSLREPRSIVLYFSAAEVRTITDMGSKQQRQSRRKTKANRQIAHPPPVLRDLSEATGRLQRGA